MFSSKGKINIVSSENTLLWELHLPQPLVSTTINIKKIDFDELNILPGDDGRLYLIHSKLDTFKLLDDSIPDLVKQSPISSSHLPNMLFRGREKHKTFFIDLDNGTLSRGTPSNQKNISFERIDYMLQLIINNSFIAWNATYSLINTTSIQYEEFYQVYHKNDYSILTQYGEEFQYIYKYIKQNKKFLLMSDQMKGNAGYDLLKPNNPNENHSYALCLIILLLIVISITFAMRLNFKVDVNKKAPKLNKTPPKKRTLDTGSEDTISQLSTGSRMTATNDLNKRNSISYREIRYSKTIRDRNGKISCNIRVKEKEDNYQRTHRESAPEYPNPINNNKKSNIKNLIEVHHEESIEEELSPNKNYTMKKIATMTENTSITPPFIKKSETMNILENDMTYNYSRPTSESFIYIKKKYNLSDDEKARLRKLNSEYLSDFKLSTTDLCQLEQCNSNSKKYFQIYKIINNSSIEKDDEKKDNCEKDNQMYNEMIQSASFSQMCDTGRFMTNFENIQLVGKGGFGSVFKAMHKIDGCYYAVKIIKFSIGIDVDISKINEVQEIKTMMKVEHKNIVRYITCWFEFEDLNVLNKKVRSLSMEYAPITKSKTRKSKGLPNSKNKSSTNQLCEFELVDNESDYSFQKSKDYESIIFGGDDENNESSNGRMEEHNETDNYFSSRNSNKNSEIIDIEKQKKQITLSYPVYFYMQMEYCEGFPLSYYLERRTANLPEGLIVHIFRQIALAVQHIHSKKIIHRDLKPANIFIHGQFKVKIGDFGLAAEINQSHKEKVGTFLYQSPEQIEGKSYNEKVDIYALGLILLEMCLFFNTESERRIILMNIRKMTYPEELDAFKSETILAKGMTNNNPNLRPSISEVINSKEMNDMIEKI